MCVCVAVCNLWYFPSSTRESGNILKCVHELQVRAAREAIYFYYSIILLKPYIGLIRGHKREGRLSFMTPASTIRGNRLCRFLRHLPIARCRSILPMAGQMMRVDPVALVELCTT